MAWNPVVQQHLMGAGRGHGGAIFDFNGTIYGQVEFPITAAEAQKIGQALAAGQDTLAGSVTVGGEKYIVTRFDTEAGTINAKKGKFGFAAAKATKTVFVSFFKDESISAGQACNAAVTAANAFAEQGY